MGVIDESDVARSFPEPTLRRLPVYHNFIKKVAESGVEYVSCTQIADALGLVPIQVRKDLELTGTVGKPKVGYPAEVLMKSIEAFLGWHNATDAFLVGVGNLGAALLGYPGFQEHGLNIVAGFDADPLKEGTCIKGKKVFSIKKMPALIKRMNIKIGILAVPAAHAQATADLMVQSGIQGIWNFAPLRISVPEHVIVQHENLASSLAVLSSKLKKVLK
jgi:redox-sensing transcriptional repressor